MQGSQANQASQRTTPRLAAQWAGILLSCWACSRAAPNSNQSAAEQREEQPLQPSTWTGSFHLLWGDPGPSQPGSPQVRYQLVTDRGDVVGLLVADSVLREFGGPRGLDGKRVTVTGDPVLEPMRGVRVRSIRLTQP